MAVFFQYRAYTKNYNLAAARICALVQEKYPDVTGSSIAEILNDNVSEKYDDNGKEFMQKYGIDMESDSVIMENVKEMKRFITIDIVAVVFMILTIAFLEFKVRFNSNKENFTDNEIQKGVAV